MTSLLHPDKLIIPLDRPVIHIFRDETDNELYCNEFGRIDGWHPHLHIGHSHGGAGRTCVHRLQRMQRTTMFGIDWVARLHWWATLIDSKHPVIASRSGDLVSLLFDKIGPIKPCVGSTTPRPLHKFVYQLHRIQFWDDENPCDQMYLGVWPN